jgi:hypothetical protein
LAEVLQYRQSGNFVATPSISWKANPKADGSLASLPLTVFGLFLIFQSVFTRNPAIDVFCNDFANEIRAGHIAQVQVGDIKYEGKFKSGVKKPNEPQTISTGRLPGIDDRPLIDEMQKQNVHIYDRMQSQSWWALISTLALANSADRSDIRRRSCARTIKTNRISNQTVWTVKKSTEASWDT